MIKIVSQDEILKITLNRPQLHNAFNQEVIEKITEAFDTLEPGIRLVTLQGEGPSFCAGADLNWMKSMAQYTQEENLKDSTQLGAMFEAMNRCPVPLLAKVHGAALGGGVGLCAVADYVLASEETQFGLTEVRLGLAPSVIGPFVVAKIGESNARAYFFSGEKFPAERALKMNLIHETAKRENLDERFIVLTENFLKAGPQASRSAKKLVKRIVKTFRGQGDSEEAGRHLADYTYDLISKLRTSPEGQEGMRALLEKRVPTWRPNEN